MTYNHVVEGALALTGYFVWHKICKSRGIFPGMQEMIRRISIDERRHMAWGTFNCRRHVAADDANWNIVTQRMDELVEPAVSTIQRIFEGESEAPFELDETEVVTYAATRLQRRMARSSHARRSASHHRPGLQPGQARGRVRRRGHRRAREALSRRAAWRSTRSPGVLVRSR